MNDCASWCQHDEPTHDSCTASLYIARSEWDIGPPAYVNLDQDKVGPWGAILAVGVPTPAPIPRAMHFEATEATHVASLLRAGLEEVAQQASLGGDWRPTVLGTVRSPLMRVRPDARHRFHVETRRGWVVIDTDDRNLTLALDTHDAAGMATAFDLAAVLCAA